MLLVFVSLYGTKISVDNKIDSVHTIISGLFIFWFSMIDICDGMRARRLKVGSPLGRFVDEAGDCIVMTSYSLIISYLLVFDHTLLDYINFYLVLGFFGMELKHKIMGQLDM